MSQTFDPTTYLRVTESHIDAQFEKFNNLISQHFGVDRRESLHKMYTEMGHRLISAPASGKVLNHLAYEGGYLDHVLNVIENTLFLMKFYEKIGGIVDFTIEEGVFAAMHHDLGKLGDLEGPYYEKETDDYWIKRGHTYKRAEGTQTSTTFDKTVFLLNHFGVTYTKKELLGIRMADGLFDPANKAYFEAYGPFPHKTSIGYIVHWADWMAANSEKDRQRNAMGMD